ncbi:protein SOGA3a [Pristis pectinata]|uniref:protein SOGA3a n=1 Tax=Pristis pectinata TaxID=685728 RepID=UPI00223CA915|nr:protein SOGA3a [Pristis pectinata]
MNTCTGHPDARELQDQLFQLKRKFKEVKKRYRQEKEVWMKEKEMILREVAGIQADENRRILLDLKSVLEGVQAEINKEEDQKAKLQHQYSKDKHGWELERKKLNWRIEQLEEKKNKRCMETTPQETRKTFETKQQCLLATMDLQKQLENSERNWSMEKMELLKCFDNERKEWESQLKDMQRKIEQIYWDVNSRQECQLHGQRKNTEDDWVPTDQGGGKNTHDSLFIEELSLKSFEKDGHGQDLGSTENDKKYSSAMNAALQEIAKVSEELCRYQEEIQKKMSTRRTKSDPYLQACQEKSNGSILLRNETSLDEKNCVSNGIFKTFHPTLSQHQKRSEELHNEVNWNHSTWDKYGISAELSGGNGVNDTSPTRGKAPPVPPRTSSLYLASSFLVFPKDHEDALKEGNSNYEIHSHIAGKSCSGPNEVKLQEYGQEVLKDGRDFKTLGPVSYLISGAKGSKDNCSQWSCDATDIVTENQYIGSKVKLSSDKSQVLSMQEQRLSKNSRPRKSVSTKTNPAGSNFPRSSKATGIFNTSSVYLQSAKDVPSGQGDSFGKAEICDPIVCGKSVVQSATNPGQGSSFAIHSVRNVNATGQLPLKHAAYAVRPHKPLSITNAKIAEPKHCHGFPHQTVDYDKRHTFDKVDMIPNNFSNPTHSWDARSNFDIGQATVRNSERSSSPSFQVKNKVSSFADDRTKQHTSCSDASHENSNRISDLFQIIHLKQENEMEKKSRQSQRASGQQLSLPATLLPVRLNGMSFSRPARPQNRRLPSRWATRSPSAPAALKLPSQRNTQAFRFDIKTSVI